MVECLTRDRRAAGSSLTGITALWFCRARHIYPILVLVQPRKTHPCIYVTERLLMGRKESNQTNKSNIFLCNYYGILQIFEEIGAVEPLKAVASQSASTTASKLAAKALDIIGEEVPHKLSQRVPLWSVEDVVFWVSSVRSNNEMNANFSVYNCHYCLTHKY